MSDKRIRISLAEKRKYCDLIRSGANYKSVNQIYKTKHKIELPKRTFYNWTRDKEAILGHSSTTKINLNSGKKTDAMKTFEDEIKKRLIKRKTKLRVRGFMQFCIDTRDELFMNEDSLKEIQFSSNFLRRLLRDLNGAKTTKRSDKIYMTKEEREIETGR